MGLSGKLFVSSPFIFWNLISFYYHSMSMGNLITDQSAAIWRGLMVMGAIDKLIRGVSWDHTDYLIVDTPPGTGDTHLSLAQNLPISGNGKKIL